MNNLDSWRAFQRHVKMHKFIFGRGGFVPLHPLPGLCPGPKGGLGGPLDPRPNLLFSKMTIVSFYNENPVFMKIGQNFCLEDF